MSGKPFERRLPPRYRPRHWAAFGRGSRPIGRAPTPPAHAHGRTASIPPPTTAPTVRVNKSTAAALRNPVPSVRPSDRASVCARVCVRVCACVLLRSGRRRSREERMRNSKLTIDNHLNGRRRDPVIPVGRRAQCFAKTVFLSLFFYFAFPSRVNISTTPPHNHRRVCVLCVCVYRRCYRPHRVSAIRGGIADIGTVTMERGRDDGYSSCNGNSSVVVFIAATGLSR